MAEPNVDEDISVEDAEVSSGYQAPAQKSVKDIVNTDTEDESLRKYKEALLGTAAGGGIIEVFPNDPRLVIVQKLAVIVDGQPDMELDLTLSPSELKKHSVVLKEDAMYQVRIHFYVQREIVQGLKYIQRTYKSGIRVESRTDMVGSYGPKNELQSFTTKPEQAPSGMLARGTYTVKSLFTDDDKYEHLKWEWKLEIKK